MPPRKRPVTEHVVMTVTPTDPTQYLSAFLHYQEAECGMSANTLLAYGSDLAQFFEWFKKHGPQQLASTDLATFTNYLQHLHDRNLASSSVARHLVAIKMFFRYLVLEGVLLASVAELLSSPKLWQHLPHVLSPEMVNRLLAAPTIEDRFMRRDRALLAVLYATGCRASEACHLKLRDVHLDEGYCRCVGKGNKERLVSLNPVACVVIKVYLENDRPQFVRDRDVEELFVSRSGQGLTRMTVWNLVKKYAARIGASQQVSPHTLRHSFATHMLAGGAEIRALQELLGHANIATTQIYTQVEHSRLKSIHKRCHPRG